MSAHLLDLPFKLIFVTWATLILRKLASGSLPSLEKLLSSNTVVQIACFSFNGKHGVIESDDLLPTLRAVIETIHNWFN